MLLAVYKDAVSISYIHFLKATLSGLVLIKVYGQLGVSQRTAFNIMSTVIWYYYYVDYRVIDIFTHYYGHSYGDSTLNMGLAHNPREQKALYSYLAELLNHGYHLTDN